MRLKINQRVLSCGRISFLTILAALIVQGCSRSDVQNGNFLQYLAREIYDMGGRTNELFSMSDFDEVWSTARDHHGILITVRGARLDGVMHPLSTAYGPPTLYLPANERRGPTYLYPAQKAGVVITIVNLGDKIQMTVTRPLDRRATDTKPTTP